MGSRARSARCWRIWRATRASSRAAWPRSSKIEPITLTRILDRLEEAGLVERRAHPKDRRIRLLHLTRKAHPLLGEIFAIGAATRGEALEGVAEADREQLFAILSSMKANLLTKAATGASGERRASHG